MFSVIKSLFKKKDSKSDEGSNIHKGSGYVFDPFKYYAQNSKSFPDLDLILNRTGAPVSKLRDLLYDSHFSSLWTVRKSPIVHSLVFFVGDYSPEIAKFLAKQLSLLDMPKMINFLMDSVAYGLSSIEFQYENIDGKIYITDFVDISPDLFVWTKDGWKIKSSAYSRDFVSFPDDKIGVFVNNSTSKHPYGERLFSRAYWMIVFKRKGIEWWTLATEKFGAPILMGRVPNNTSDDRKVVLLDALKNLVSSGVSVLNDSESVELLSSGYAVSDTPVRYEDYVRFMNSELSKIILGQTLTSDIGKIGSRAAAEVHNKVREDVLKADRVLIASYITNIFRQVVSFNFSEGADSIDVVLDGEENTDIGRVSRDKLLFEMVGVKPTEDYLSLFKINKDYYE